MREVTLSLLDPARPAYTLRTQVLELKSIFEQATGASELATGETKTECGVAISPAMAAMCVDDFARTVQFLRGTLAAVADLRSTVIERAVRVLYAGCGPWAALAVR